MARGLIADLAFYRDPLNSNSLYIGENPEVTVYEAGTTTLVDPDTIYSVPTGGSPLGTNPVQGNPDGSFVFWVEDPRLLKLSINVPGIGLVVRDNIPTWTDPGQDVTLDGFQIFSNKTMEDWLSKDGAFFDVGAYRYNSSTLLYDENGLDPYDMTNDATPALHLACAAAEAVGGGHVMISKMISIKTTFEHYYINVKIVCVGDGTVSATHKVGIRLDVPRYPAIAIRDKEDEYGTAGYTSTGNECQYHDVTFYFNNTILPGNSGDYNGCEAVVLVYKSSPTGDGSSPSFDDNLDFNGRVHFHGCAWTGGTVNLQIGKDAVVGAAEVIIDHCKFQSDEDSILTHGVSYLFIYNIIAGQMSRVSGTGFLRIAGSCTKQPDSLTVRDVFTEDYWGAVLVRNGAGSVGNALIEGCVFDGCELGIWIDAVGTVNGLIIRNNYITGYSTGNGTTGVYLPGADSNTATHETGDHELVPNSYGILIQAQSAGSVGGLHIHHNKISNFTREAINVTATSALGKIVDIDIEYNRCFDCGSQSGAGAAMIDICGQANGTSTFGVVRMTVRGNIIRTAGIFTDAHAAGVVVDYGITIGLTCDDFLVELNTALSVSVARVNKLQAGNLTDKIYRNNVGPHATSEAPCQMSWNIDGWWLSNVAANTNGGQLNRSQAGPRGWIAPYDCLIVGFTVEASANVAGSAITFKVAVNGAVSNNLIPSVGVGQSTGVATSDTGVAVSRGQKVELLTYTDGSYTSTTNDYSADLQAVTIGS